MFASQPMRSLKCRVGLGIAAAAAAVPLAVAFPGATAAASTRATWSTDWANSSFCSAYHAPYMGTTFNGVASCGQAYSGSSNEQGNISYNGVELDSVGFQCVELVARYFYYVSGERPPIVGFGSDYAWGIHAKYSQYPVSPGGATGGTNIFANTIVPGDIISMWSRSDETPGHVAVVSRVSVNSGGNGSITVMEENASSTGSGTISVSNHQMLFAAAGFNIFQWVYGLPGSPSVTPPPTSYPYNVANTGGDTLNERSGPGTNYSLTGSLAAGAAINIVCQTTGTSVNGGNIWDKLTTASYVSDYYTTTPNFDAFSPPIPHC